MRRFAVLIAAALVLGGCQYPRDTEGTLDRVRGGTLRVGVAPAEPWSAVERRLVREFAETLDARVEWVEGTESDLMEALDGPPARRRHRRAHAPLGVDERGGADAAVRDDAVGDRGAGRGDRAAAVGRPRRRADRRRGELARGGEARDGHGRDRRAGRRPRATCAARPRSRTTCSTTSGSCAPTPSSTSTSTRWRCRWARTRCSWRSSASCSTARRTRASCWREEGKP